MSLTELRVRPLLLTLMAVLSVISLVAIGWNGYQVTKDIRRAEWISATNRLAQAALNLNTTSAMERGITAAILADTAHANDEMRAEMHKQRSDGNEFYLQVMRISEELMGMRPRVVAPVISRLQERRASLEAYRDLTDRVLSPDTTHTENAEAARWIEIATGYIESIAELRRTAMAPLEEVGHTHQYDELSREILFATTEYAGRERAIIGAAIARQRALSPKEIAQLDQYRTMVDKGLGQIFALVNRLPGSLEIARQDVQQEFLGRYEQLRKAVYGANSARTGYPVDAKTWYDEATRGIRSIIALSDAIGRHMDEDVAIIEHRAVSTSIALTLTVGAVIVTFLLAFLTVRRRVLMPLQTLEAATQVIASGNLSQPVQVLSNDEFGALGLALNEMRKALLTDIGERERANAELHKLKQAIEHSLSSIVMTDPDGIVEYVNLQFTRTTGYQREEVIGQKFNRLKSGKTLEEKYRQLWDAITAGEIWEGEILNRKKNGELYWELVSISPIKNPEGKITHFVGVQHDITDRKRLEEQLNYLAYYDELTQLPNRNLMRERLQQAISYARRYGRQAAVLFLDIDQFKVVNDSLGHDSGERLLQAVAKMLGEHVRQGDTLARYGGDEFVMVLSDLSGLDDVTLLGKQLLQTVSRPIYVMERELRITCSIGASIFPRDGVDAETLLRNADAAMYRAKELGRNQAQFYTEEMNERATQRLILENELRRALEREEFVLHYQPQVDMKTGQTVGLEALVRWEHPEFGLVSPARFIPLAEETGLIAPLGEWVLRTACGQAVQWQQAGLRPIVMAVNLSARQLAEAALPSKVAAALEEAGLEARYLELELTESSVMGSPEVMARVLHQLKAMGVRLVVDDFGTGYSSLAHLRHFPFDKLKIDRSFVSNITSNPDEAAIALTIIAMAHSLRLRVVAEGIETESQACYLQRNDCDEMQGYLFSHPLSTEATAEFLAEDRSFELTVCGAAAEGHKTLLIVEHEADIVRALRRILADDDYQVLSVRGVYEAFELLATREIGAVICSQRLPEMSGLDFLLRLKELHPKTARVLLVNQSEVREATAAVANRQVTAFLTLPWNEQVVRSQIRNAFDAYRSKAQEGAGPRLTRVS